MRLSKTITNFLRYIQIDTQSEETSMTAPSTAKQHHLARLLTAELSAMGAEEIVYDEEHCYVYATIPASEGFENNVIIGFIAHMDTSPAVSGRGVKARIVEQYDGKDILLNQEKDVILRTEEFPEIKAYAGKDLIVTDGTTLLGADDKAGIAQIMAMAEYFLIHKEIQHGKIRIAFTPDEEIGRGTDYFNLAKFGADYAYTVDGGALGELEYENFNAAGAKLTVFGQNVHPGSAKGKMKNAILISQEFQGLLPVSENPMYTEGYEGFYHIDSIRGNVERVEAEYIIRDHDRQLFEQKKQTFINCVDFLNTKYGEGTVEVSMSDSYYNMKEVMLKNMHLIENAERAMKELGIEPIISPIRGGTDGARLSFLGLPCPNLCTGGANYHSRFEYACIQDMESVTQLLIRIVLLYCFVEKGRKL